MTSASVESRDTDAKYSLSVKAIFIIYVGKHECRQMIITVNKDPTYSTNGGVISTRAARTTVTSHLDCAINNQFLTPYCIGFAHLLPLPRLSSAASPHSDDHSSPSPPSVVLELPPLLRACPILLLLHGKASPVQYITFIQ